MYQVAQQAVAKGIQGFRTMKRYQSNILPYNLRLDVFIGCKMDEKKWSLDKILRIQLLSCIGAIMTKMGQLNVTLFMGVNEVLLM